MGRVLIFDRRVHIGSPLPLTFSAVQALWSAMSHDKESVLLGSLKGKRKSDSKRHLTTELRKWRERTRCYLMRYSTCIAGQPRRFDACKPGFVSTCEATYLDLYSHIASSNNIKAIFFQYSFVLLLLSSSAPECMCFLQNKINGFIHLHFFSHPCQAVYLYIKAPLPFYHRR